MTEKFFFYSLCYRSSDYHY